MFQVKVEIHQIKRLEDGGDGCITPWMHLMPLNGLFKVVKTANSVMSIYHSKKIQKDPWNKKYQSNDQI